MSALLQAPAGPNVAPARGWIKRIRENLDQHIFFWITLLIALYIFFFVPQITNVWQQQPPLQGGFQAMAGYLIFLTFLIGFYVLSMFVVIRRFPVQWVQRRVEAFVAWHMKRWQQQGPRRFYHLHYWLSVLTWRAPDLCCRWLVWSVSNPKRRTGLPLAALAMLVVALAGATGLMIGTNSDTSRAYPLAGAFCQNMALLSLAAAIWLAGAIPGCNRGVERPREVWLYFGRFIAWLIATAIVGELLWVLAYTNWHDNQISYRLYTIWAVFELLTILVIVGLLVDRWHDATDRWPVRQVAIVLLPGLVWLFSRALPVEARELDRHLTPDQIQVWKKLRPAEKGPDAVAWHSRADAKWFAHLSSRVQQVPESEPVVIVAASGGGSRAAIFTAMVLETLARTPTAKDAAKGETPPIADQPEGTTQRTWADNIVLISSVSGGSLASAYHVERRKPKTPPERVPLSPSSQQPVLLNTSPAELKYWGLGYARDLIQTYLEEPPDGFPVQLLKDYYAKDETARNDPAVALAALSEAAPPLNKRLDEVVADRKKLAIQQKQEGLDPAKAEKLTQRIIELSETAAALRTALALLNGYRFLEASSAPDADQALAGSAGALPGRWLWSSRAFDEMCVDFMAPLARGVLTPALDRGDALARFWTHRFDWSNCTNFSGYHGPLTDWNYSADRPAIVLNAVDVARGSRLAIGFPPVPSNLWDAVYQRRVTREVPRALNAPISLARAVRMSSNFPYGFRAMEFQTPSRITPDPAAGLKPAASPPQRELAPVHVLDGGVVDNTGLDTIYELVAAMEYHAEPKNHSPYGADASAVLANLRRHGVCVLEIDAGAKPNTALPWRFNPIGGIMEQSQSLENGAYSNADRAKQLYLKEIRRILAQRLNDPGLPMASCSTYLRDLDDALPPTALHYCFQCNHYQPGQGADPAIMTAWTLGPRDKAEVLARFLPELGLWDQRREQLWEDIADSKMEVARVQTVARLRCLLHQATALGDKLEQLSLEIAKIEKIAHRDNKVAPNVLAPLQMKFAKNKDQLTLLVDAIAHEKDEGLLKAWENLDGQLREDATRLALLQQASKADEPMKVRDVLQQSKPDRDRQSEESFKQIRAGLHAAESRATTKITEELKRAKVLDPQCKYDQANRQTREVYDKQPAQRGK